LSSDAPTIPTGLVFGPFPDRPYDRRVNGPWHPLVRFPVPIHI